jgi:hypothetical protein
MGGKVGGSRVAAEGEGPEVSPVADGNGGIVPARDLSDEGSLHRDSSRMERVGMISSP